MNITPFQSEQNDASCDGVKHLAHGLKLAQSGMSLTCHWRAAESHTQLEFMIGGLKRRKFKLEFFQNNFLCVSEHNTHSYLESSHVIIYFLIVSLYG